MYISTIKLEKAALEDFHKEANDRAELERKQWWNEAMPFQIYSEVKSRVDEADIEMMEGGGRGEFEMENFGGESHGYKKKSSNKGFFSCLTGGDGDANQRETQWA